MIGIHDGTLLDKEKLFDYLRWNSYLSQRYKLFYIATPKVACTSLKWWFAALEGHSLVLRGIIDSAETDPDLVIHDTFHKVAPNVTGLMPEALSEALTSDSYFRFAVVRNPYHRIFSAWQSKLLLQEPLQTRPYLQCEFFHRPIECADDIATAFEDFLVHLAINEAPSYWDVHWTPQVILLRPDLINYSQLVKIENAKELSQALTARLGEHIPNPFANRRTNESLIPYLPEFVTERSTELIRSLYAEDFDTFGYSNQPPEAKETFTADQFNLAFKAIALIRGRHQRLGERNGQITSLTQTVAKRDEQIASINQAVAEEIHRLNSIVLAKNDAIEVQAEEIHRLNAVVTDKAAAYQAVAEELQRVHGTLLAKNDAIEIQAEEIRQLSSELKDTRHEVAQHKEEINSLRSLLTQRDQSVDTLNNSLRHMEEVLTNVKEELLRAEAELQAIRRTKWFRLQNAIIHQPWGFRKIARVGYLAGVMAIPPLIRARLSPSVFRIRARLNALRPALLSNSNENSAYLVLQPAPALLNRPHVAHIIANFMTGGSSRLVVDLIEYLGAYYEQSVVTSYIPTPPAYIGVDITEFRFPENEQLFINHFSQLKPDLLHVHYWGDCDEPWYENAIAAAEHLGIPIVENINTPVTPYVSDAVRRYVYVSDYVRHVFGQNHPSHITVYPGSDFSHFDRKSGERLADDCIGMVYRMERDKLNEGAIVPFIKAVQKRPQTRVLIVGGGSLLELFRHAVVKAGLNDNFEFTGYVSYDALPDLYRRMSVFVAPVWKESFGQVSAFAMNMRIPVVGYDIGAIGEIVANQALLAEPENSEMLSDIIVRLLESPAEREKLGELQRRRAQDYFSVQAMIKAYGAIYQEMMAEHAPKIYERVV